jgi:hypothetical protein
MPTNPDRHTYTVAWSDADQADRKFKALFTPRRLSRLPPGAGPPARRGGAAAARQSAG